MSDTSCAMSTIFGFAGMFCSFCQDFLRVNLLDVNGEGVKPRNADGCYLRNVG